MKGGLLRAGLVFVLLTLVYCIPPPREDVYDSLPARYLPLSLLREGNLDLDEFSFLHDTTAAERWSSVEGLPYFLRRQDGHVVSAFSPGVALLAVPVYAVPTWMGVAPESPWMPRLEHTAAAVLAALAAVCVWQALRQVVAEIPAAFLAFVFAFGTSAFSIASRALWEHTGGQLCLAAALWVLARSARLGTSPALAGLALGAAVLMRPTNLVVVLPLALYALWVARPRERATFLVLLAAPLALLLAYNTLTFGAPWRTGRDRIIGADKWNTSLWQGFLGLLVSPGRGLLVYSPVFLLLPLALRAAWRERSELLGALWVGTGLLLVLCSARTAWWGGWCFGPRLLADLAPVLVFLLYPVFRDARWRSATSVAAVFLAACSVTAHAAGAFYYEGRFEARPNVDLFPGRLWKLSAAPLALSMTAARNDLQNARREAEALRRGLPKSRDRDAVLAARYEPVPPLTEAVPDGSAVYADVCAINSGHAVWMARAPGYRGAVRLGWRWWQGDQPLADPYGRDDLPYPIFPGERHCFRAWIDTPATPGVYTLELGLVSELVTWFGERDKPKVRLPYQRRPVRR